MDENNYDKAKQDESIEPMASRIRRCYVKLVNNYGHRVEVLEFTHRNGINDWTEHPGILENNQSWGPKPMDYQTGPFSNRDHWYVKFKDDLGATFDNNPGFDCSPESEDEGKEIYVKIWQKLRVEMSDGDACEESWIPR